MAYGQSQSIKLYQKSLYSSGNTGNGARDFVNHSTSNIYTLKFFWITPEDQFINVESTESTSIALGTTPVAESDKTPVTTNNKSPPLPSTTGSIRNTSSGSGATTVDGSDITPSTTKPKKSPSSSTTESIRNDAGSQRNHTKKNRTVPTVTSTSNNDSTRGLLNCKSPPSLCYNPAPCKRLFYAIDPVAGYYMLPTCGWVTVATALQWSIYFKNKKSIK
jgi:hypothetical protein